MPRWPFRFWPRGIAGQIVMLVVCAILVFQVASAALFALTSERPDRVELFSPLVADRFAHFVKVLDHVPADARARVLEAMREASPTLAISLLSGWDALRLNPDSRLSGRISQPRTLVDLVSRILGPEFALYAPPPPPEFERGHQTSNVAVVLHDGSMVVATLPATGGAFAEPRPIFLVVLTLALIATLLVTFLWWATQALTAPLARFARAAGEFSLEGGPATLIEESGPDEVRAASRALNRMQDRIRRLIDSRTRMLAAVSHDLRTPITRMRLRAEFIDLAETRGQMLRDLDQMDRMVRGALSYLRDGPDRDRRALVDMATLLQTVCNDFSDLGGEVIYQGPAHLLVRADSDELQRAVTNLLDNAMKHGGNRAAVRLEAISQTDIVVDVSDQGPGISDASKETLLEPFARGDSARTMNDTAGFGLGLTIVKSAAEAHGGTLNLRDAQPSGLIASLHLPIRAADFAIP